MSLDVTLEVEGENLECVCRCGHTHRNTNPVEVHSANITHNLGEMAQAAGIYKELWRPEEEGLTKAHQLIAPLTSGLARLKGDPEGYARYNPRNGWGDYVGLVRFVEKYCAACEEYPNADVRVSR